MEHLICRKCGADLISTGKDVWECPKCGAEYEVGVDFIVEVGDKPVVEAGSEGVDVVTKRISKGGSVYQTPLGKNKVFYYILSFVFPVAGLIFALILWRKEGMRDIARHCLYISGALLVLNFGFVLLMMVVAIFTGG